MQQIVSRMRPHPLGPAPAVPVRPPLPSHRLFAPDFGLDELVAVPEARGKRRRARKRPSVALYIERVLCPI